MPTIQQLIRNRRQPVENRTKSPALQGCPQRRGVCTRVYGITTESPPFPKAPYYSLPDIYMSRIRFNIIYDLRTPSLPVPTQDMSTNRSHMAIYP
ncbi:hypothetical protein O6H91_22G001400, partial [Diphasiastrum complanatum]